MDEDQSKIVRNLNNGDTIATAGIDPQGNPQLVTVSGPAIINSELLGVNATWNSGWLPCERYKAMLYAIQSDKPSATNGITIEYSDDGITANAGGISRSYTTNPSLFQTALTPKPNFVRLTYKNGSQAQTSNYILILLSDTSFQGTMSSVSSSVTGTNLAQITKSVLELPDTSGAYSQVTRTGTAQDVNVVNPTSPISNPSNATVTNATTTSQSSIVLPANPARKGAMFSSVTGTILIKLGLAASATSYTARLVTNGYYELPQPAYTGVITAIGAGTLLITEVY